MHLATRGASSRAVKLHRDEHGMAHVYAEREEDGYYGIGYALAEDRLHQVPPLTREALRRGRDDEGSQDVADAVNRWRPVTISFRIESGSVRRPT